MKILIVEPFYGGSHAAWADGYAKSSDHDVDTLTLSGAHWKWRMHGGAVTLARRFLENDLRPDLLVASDMLDLTTFLSLTRRRTAGIPTAIYFHENQLTYPWSHKDRDRFDNRDRHYVFVNFVSALAADRVYFNSRYHMESFLGELPGVLAQFPDHQERTQVERIREKSEVLHLGLDLAWLDRERPAAATHGAPERAGQRATPRAAPKRAAHPPLIIWNHRWEHDKNPDEFFAALEALADRALEFEVAVLGETTDVVHERFVRARERLGSRIVHYGYVEDAAGYARWLWRGNILPVTSIQDFFGGSVVQAIYCGCFPLLPRRLAYPELIPDEWHDACFYNDFDDLLARLEGLITGATGTRPSHTVGLAETFPATAEPVTRAAESPNTAGNIANTTKSLAHAVAAFDWHRMAPAYDATFENLVRRMSC